MYSNPTSANCISHGNWAGSLISCSAKHPKAFRERLCLIFCSNVMISGNYSHGEVRWQGALISLLSKQFWEVLLGAPLAGVAPWGTTWTSDPTSAWWGQQRPTGGGTWACGVGALYEPLPEYEIFASHRKWTKGQILMLKSSSYTGCKLSTLYLQWKRATLGKDQTEPETGTTYPSMPSATHGKENAFYSWKILKGIVISTTSTFSSLRTRPTENPSTLAPSSIEWAALPWYWARSQGMGTTQLILQLCLAEVSGFSPLCLMS